jgi:hypothetical protein
MGLAPLLPLRGSLFHRLAIDFTFGAAMYPEVLLDSCAIVHSKKKPEFRLLLALRSVPPPWYDRSWLNNAPSLTCVEWLSAIHELSFEFRNPQAIRKCPVALPECYGGSIHSHSIIDSVKEFYGGILSASAGVASDDGGVDCDYIS